MLRRFRQWRALPHADRAIVLAMMLALPVVSLGLRAFGYVRMRRWIERASSRSHAPPVADELARGERLARLAAIAGRHGPLEASCLRQSLLVYGLLRRRGSAPELKIGVRREDAGIAAHAWVELAGVSLDQTPRNHSPFPDARPRGDQPA